MSNLSEKRKDLVLAFAQQAESWSRVLLAEANQSLIDNHHKNREYNDLIDISEKCKQLSKQAREKL